MVLLLLLMLVAIYEMAELLGFCWTGSLQGTCFTSVGDATLEGCHRVSHSNCTQVGYGQSEASLSVVLYLWIE